MGLTSEERNSDDRMRATAESLIRIATKAFMQMYDVDYETAERWIAAAAVVEPKNKKPARKSLKTQN